MVAQFFGGPLDGLSFTHEQIKQVAEPLLTSSQSGPRNFLLIPSPTDCTRILRGEVSKQECQGSCSVYECLRKADGSVEYHEAGGAIGHAMHQQNIPLSREQEALKVAFAETADRFINRLISVGVHAGTQIHIVRLYRDRQGGTFRGVLENIGGRDTLRGFDAEMAKRWADASNLDTAIMYVNSIVRQAATDFVDFPGHPSGVLQVYDFELLIDGA